jgi:CHAD domain-containing protein
MAFELRPSEPPRRGLRRLARKELAAAREAIRAATPPSEEAVFTARKSLKKVRAVLQLIDADGGRGLGGAKSRLRKVNRTLSCVRDADALIQTLATLKAHQPKLFSEHRYARIRRGLVAGQRAALAGARHRDAWQEAAHHLRVLRASAQAWTTRHRGFSAMAPGIRDVARRARLALARAKETNVAADFHAWRKEMKALWYALRLVGGGTAAIGRDLRALQSAERWLGDDHNLVVLCATLAKDPNACRGPLQVARLQDAVNATQAMLRRKAIARTRTIFTIRPRDYATRVERAYRARR